MLDKEVFIKEIGEKIRNERRKLKMSSIEFAKKIGISTSKLLRIETGIVEPGINDLIKICEFLGIDLGYLIDNPKLFKISPDFVYIPLVEGKISAGKGLIPQNNIEDFLAFKKEWIQKKGDVSKMVLIRVSGDSMEPTLRNGDIVMVDTSKNYIDPQGGIYAIMVEDEIMIKRLKYVFQKKHEKTEEIEKKIKVISDNSLYDSFELDIEDIVINGRVIWYGREL